MAGSFLTSDLSAVFSTADFSVTAAYTSQQGDAATLTGIFDDEDVEIDHGDNQRYIQRSARLTCPVDAIEGTLLTEAGAPIQTEAGENLTAWNLVTGDTIFVQSVEYTLAYTKYDGTGIVELYLEKT